jgi:hypothetical protein
MPADGSPALGSSFDRCGEDDGHAGGGPGAGDAVQLGLARADPYGARSDSGVAHQTVHRSPLVRQHEGDDGAGLAGACGTAAAVEVVLVVAGRVYVHDEVEAVDVDSAGGDVGGHQGRDMAVLELGERPVAL